MWVDDGEPNGNTYRNVVWSSEAVPLFETNRRINADALKLLLLALHMEPTEMPEVDRSVIKKAYLNRKGDDPFPYEKIGRFQYPRNALYF